MNFPDDILTVVLPLDAFERAHKIAPGINRHKASDTVSSDTVIGVLGEMAWAQLRYGSWDVINQMGPIGTIDDDNVEVKCSKTKLRVNLNLLAKEEYVKRRSPDYYVQFILEDNNCHLVGWATGNEVETAPLKDFGTKFGRGAGYRCHYIPIKKLHKPIELLRILKDEE